MKNARGPGSPRQAAMRSGRAQDSRTDQVRLREVQTTELRSCSEVERPVEGGDIFIAAR
jgi:hypothetical protein